MEKLELKNLAPYLPYRLGIQNPKNYVFSGYRIDCQNIIMEGLREEYITFYEVPSFYPIADFKPILRPLSDITKPIKVEGYNEGKEFVPSKILFPNDELMTELEDDVDVFINRRDRLDLCYPLDFWQKLYQWHFAIDIPEDLYININTYNHGTKKTDTKLAVDNWAKGNQ